MNNWKVKWKVNWVTNAGQECQWRKIARTFSGFHVQARNANDVPVSSLDNWVQPDFHCSCLTGVRAWVCMGACVWPRTCASQLGSRTCRKPFGSPIRYPFHFGPVNSIWLPNVNHRPIQFSTIQLIWIYWQSFYLFIFIWKHKVKCEWVTHVVPRVP